MSKFTLAFLCLACTSNPTPIVANAAAEPTAKPAAKPRPHATPPRVIARKVILCPAPKRKPLNLVEMSGTWNVTLRAVYSTCSRVKAGDVQRRQWLIDTSDGIKLQVVGTEKGEPSNYSGDFQPLDPNASLSAQVLDDDPSEVTLFGTDKGGSSGIQLWWEKTDQLLGRRVVAGSYCAIVFDVTAER
jgi:hypothetical protein